MPAVLPIIASVVGIAGGVNSLRNSRGARQAGSDAAAASDPFAGERGQYQDMLAQMLESLITPPDLSDVENDPGYQFERDEGLGAITNMASAGGLLRSGNRMQDMARFASNLAHTRSQARANATWGRQMNVANLLSILAGAQSGSPGAAGAAILSGENMGSSNFNSGINAILGGLSTFPGAGKPDPSLNINT